MTLKASRNATGLQGLEAGPTPQGSPASPMTSPSGPAPVLVSRSVQQDKGAAKMTNDMSGQNSCGSFENADPPLFSESKSPALAVGNGSAASQVCKDCMTERPLRDFYRHPNSAEFRKICKPCSRQKEKERAAARRTYKAEKAKEYRKKYRGRELLRMARQRAEKKGLSFTLEEAPIQDVIDVGVCELTGIPFSLDGGKTWDSPSIDRIDSSKGYTRNNVRVVLHCLNVMANVWGENKIIQIADAIMEKRLAASFQFQESLTSALKQRMNLHASPEYALTWKTWGMPSGPPICRLRASARRMSANACGGLQLPSLNANEWKGAGRSRFHGSPYFRGSKMSEGLRVCETDGMYLSPYFAIFIMGYPVAWTECAPQAIQSSRKSRRNS